MLKLSDYEFYLPKELIAKYPEKNRTSSKLLHLQMKSHQIQDRKFTDILNLLQPNDLLIFNNTKVIPARLFAQKETGGNVEILVERLMDENNALAHIKASKAPKSGMKLYINEKPFFSVVDKENHLYHIRTCSNDTILDILYNHGHIPLPPYIERAAELSDKERYQTVYAEIDGSVAAPTAGLHFDNLLLKKLQEKGVAHAFVTLHVGAGTFQPVRDEDITKHDIHHEWLSISQEACDKINAAKAKGGRIICVGTTSVRSIETASTLNGHVSPYVGDTNLFIYPGYKFKAVDAIITNFHLPKSSLLMLVSAFAGFEFIKTAYQHAVDYEYRFFSYGDAMFIES